jgi:hypothetical protein
VIKIEFFEIIMKIAHIECDEEMEAALEYYKFMSECMKKPEPQPEEQEVSLAPSRFSKACMAFLMNPLFKQPMGRILSMGEMIRIKNPRSITQQLT